MADAITVEPRFQNEHAKNQTEKWDVYCIPKKPNRLGWERRHSFKLARAGARATNARAANTLMIRMKGTRYIYKWEEPLKLTEIAPHPLDELFRVKPDNTTKDDNHFDTNRKEAVPPFCGWWGFGKFNLTLVVAKWKDEETAKKYSKSLGKTQKASEAPEFANNNNPDDTQGMEGLPTYDDIKMDPLEAEDEGDKSPYTGTLKYAYLPMHCGGKTIEQILADPGAKATLAKELENYKGGGDAPRTLNDIVKTRGETLKYFGSGFGISLTYPAGSSILVGGGEMASVVAKSSLGGAVPSGLSIVSVGWSAPMSPVVTETTFGGTVQPGPSETTAVVSPTEAPTKAVTPSRDTLTGRD